MDTGRRKRKKDHVCESTERCGPVSLSPPERAWPDVCPAHAAPQPDADAPDPDAPDPDAADGDKAWSQWSGRHTAIGLSRGSRADS